MCLHIRGLHLCEFLMGKLPCLPSPMAPQPVFQKQTTNDAKEKLLADFDYRLASYESQFCTYMTWLDEDAHAVVALVASIEDRFAADIVEFDWAHQMLTFLHDRYEPIG
jgi:hypothetical protein